LIRARKSISSAEVSVTVYECDGAHVSWSQDEPIGGFCLMLVQRGSFRRRVDGADTLTHPLVAYMEQPGFSQQIAHPAGGDVCTGIGLSVLAMGSLLDPARLPPDAVLHLEPRIDLAHRLLLKYIANGADSDQVLESAMQISAHVIDRRDDIPESRPAHRRIAEHAREALCVDPSLSLRELATMLGVSMYHLSRVFKSVTGCTVSRYRLRLRSQAAMAHIADGDANLAELAAELGFADQSHMTRALMRELRVTPRQLKEVLHVDYVRSL
jgi:AraC-like DNA-binding protein